MTIPGEGEEPRRPEEGLPQPRDGGPRGLGGSGEGEPARSELSAAAFDDIIAVWNAEGRVPQWPATADEPTPEPLPTAQTISDPEPVDDTHFVPPEPPPLPRIGPLAVVGLVLLGLGLLLLIAPALVGVPAPLGVPLGLVALACGVGWLVLRLWSAPPPRGDGDGEDDGAVL